MEGFTSREVIDQEVFTIAVDAHLEKALNPKTSIEDSMATALIVADKFTAIDSGKLEVQPPLEAEALASYKTRVGDIMAIGQKAIDGLNAAKTESQSSRKGRRKEKAIPATTFRGAGASAKS